MLRRAFERPTFLHRLSSWGICGHLFHSGLFMGGLPFFAALAAFARRLVLDDTSKVTASFARAIAAVAS